GACVSICNPACGSGERCTPAGECIAATSSSTPAPVAAAPSITAASVPAPAAEPRTRFAPAVPERAPDADVAPGPPAQSLAGLPRVHDGLYFSGSLGPALVATGTATTPSNDDISLSGGGVEVQLAIGGGLGSGVILGGTIFGTSVSTITYSQSGYSVE